MLGIWKFQRAACTSKYSVNNLRDLLNLNILTLLIFEESVLNNQKCPATKTLAIVFQILLERTAARTKIGV